MPTYHPDTIYTQLSTTAVLDHQIFSSSGCVPKLTHRVLGDKPASLLVYLQTTHTRKSSRKLGCRALVLVPILTVPGQ